MTDKQELETVAKAVESGDMQTVASMIMGATIEVVEAELLHFIKTFGAINLETFPTAIADAKERVESAKKEAWGESE